MQGLLAGDAEWCNIAELSVLFADDLIAELKKTEGDA